MNLVKLIPISILQNAANSLTTTTVLTLQQADKKVTGRTAQSIRTAVVETNEGYDLEQYGGQWVKYIIEGKPANTKLPVKKVGDKFELVQPLKDWKAVKGLAIPDFLLARSIARNPREPFDLPSKSIELFSKQFQSKLSNKIIQFTAQEVGKDIQKNNS